MPSIAELRQRHNDHLLELVRSTRYPSVALLQRVESGLQDIDAAKEYVGLLMERVENDQFPSLELVDRVSTLLKRLESFEEQQQEQEAARG
jgi:hypothetical protein